MEGLEQTELANQTSLILSLLYVKTTDYLRPAIKQANNLLSSTDYLRPTIKQAN